MCTSVLDPTFPTLENVKSRWEGELVSAAQACHLGHLLSLLQEQYAEAQGQTQCKGSHDFIDQLEAICSYNLCQEVDLQLGFS